MGIMDRNSFIHFRILLALIAGRFAKESQNLKKHDLDVFGEEENVEKPKTVEKIRLLRTIIQMIFWSKY